MNYSLYTTIVNWETRNWRHHKKAVLWCHDYGLKSATKYFFVGRLYSKEREELSEKFQNLFTGKTEKFFFVNMCRSCFNESMSDQYFGNIRKDIEKSVSFELIQVSQNKPKNGAPE